MPTFPPHPTQVATRLAVGVVELQKQIVAGNSLPVTSPQPQFRAGLEQLSVLCLAHSVRPPAHHQETVQWLHTPMEQWLGLESTMATAGLSGALLFHGVPTEYAYDLAFRVEGDSNLEIDDLLFKDILEYCQQNRLESQYTNARQFLVEHSYLQQGTHLINSNLDWDKPIADLLCAIYERIPLKARVSKNGTEMVALCPRCGWTLEWYGDYASCYNDLCGRLVERIHPPDRWIPYHLEMVRVNRGVQQYVVAPERMLLVLKSALEQMGATCELWVAVDSYDLWVQFPSGVRWAIDLKDYSSPTRLASAFKPFKRYPEWDECFYVIPDYRKVGNYNKQLQVAWKARYQREPELQDIKICYVKQILKKAERVAGGRV